jgi:hypothetical protein
MEIEKRHCVYGLAELTQPTGQWQPTAPGRCSMWPVRTLDVHGTQSPCRGTTSARDAARSSMENRWCKFHSGGRQTTHSTRPMRHYTGTSKGMMARGFSPQQSLALRKGTAAKGVGDGVLLLHKHEEDIRN